MVQLGVNIDHVATLREARYRLEPRSDAVHPEPDPVMAAHEAQLGGADGITVHLREDRRHMGDRDVTLLRELVTVKLNLEMAATEEMVEIARSLKPDTAMLVPEGRQEVTTEGGLDVATHQRALQETVTRLHDAGLIVSAFLDAEPRQIKAASQVGFDVCEIHTGPYAHAFARAGGDFRRKTLVEALDAVTHAGTLIVESGMRLNAGHALNYVNVGPIAALPGLSELHIGHAIISRAVFVGLRAAVAQMKDCMRRSQRDRVAE